MNNDVTVIIRTAGERTVNCCAEIIYKQVPKENVFILEEEPFSKAVTVGFEIGIQQAKKWTLAIDADLLLANTAINKMIIDAEKIKEDIYIYQGMILDYLFGEYRFGGPHLYKTCHLPLALNKMSTSPNELRPESYTYRLMAQLGHITYCNNVCYSLHEYEQYSKDYYRKGFFHGKKALTDQVITMLTYWREKLKEDDNFQIALLGMVDGLIFEDEIKADRSFFQKRYEEFTLKTNVQIPIQNELLTIEDEYVSKQVLSHQKLYPNIQPSSWEAYKLDKKGKIYITSDNTLNNSSLRTFVSKSLRFVGRKIVNLSKRIQ